MPVPAHNTQFTVVGYKAVKTVDSDFVGYKITINNIITREIK